MYLFTEKLEQKRLCNNCKILQINQVSHLKVWFYMFIVIGITGKEDS